MKTLQAVLIGFVSGAASSAVTVQLVKPEPAAAQLPAAPGASAELTALEERLQQVAAEQTALAAAVDGLRLQSPDTVSERLPLVDIEAAVDRALAARVKAAGDAPSQALQDIALATDTELDLDSVLASLRANDFESGVAREQFWQDVRDAGLMDGVVAAFEKRALEDPSNPDAQVDLGEVYIQKIMEYGQGPMAGVFAAKADEAFNDALALDDSHWEARFTKATALSFWPPVFGKQAEAIQQYEILAEQQSGLATRDEFEQTYLLLGNLYQQSGKSEKALDAWNRGLELFPDSQALIGQIEVSKD